MEREIFEFFYILLAFFLFALVVWSIVFISDRLEAKDWKKGKRSVVEELKKLKEEKEKLKEKTKKEKYAFERKLVQVKDEENREKFALVDILMRKPRNSTHNEKRPKHQRGE